MMRMVRPVVAWMLMAFASCSWPGPAAAPGENDASAAPTPTATARIVGGEPCPDRTADSETNDTVGCFSHGVGDFDGDGSSDDLTVFAGLDSGGYPSSWFARLHLANGETIEEKLTIGSKFGYPIVLGAVDANGDGDDEAFVRTGTHLYHSGATHDVGIFVLDGSGLSQVREARAPFEFEVGAISYFALGAECRDIDFDGSPEFVVLRIDGVINDVQRWSERIYRWKGDSLVFEERLHGRLAKTSYSDPLLRRFYGLACFSFDPAAPY